MPTLPPGSVWHQVDVYLPSTELSNRGRRTGADTLVLESIPAAIQQLTALELIRARRIYAEASHSVRMTVWPAHPITTEHYLLFGTRKLHIGAIVDAAQQGVEIELLCREEVG